MALLASMAGHAIRTSTRLTFPPVVESGGRHALRPRKGNLPGTPLEGPELETIAYDTVVACVGARHQGIGAVCARTVSP